MRWSLKVAQVAGIGIFVHLTFLIVPIVVAYFAYQRQGVAEAISAIIFTLALFGCVVLHELGHSLTAMRFGIKTRDIILLPIGGVARLEKMPENPMQELVVALAGPAVNVVIAAVLFALLLAGGGGFWDLDPERWPFLQQLMLVNVVLVIFNMIPAFPMDGGRVLRACLAMLMDYAAATRIAAMLGQTIAIGFGLFGLFSNPFLVLIAVFVWFGAAQESNMVQMKSMLGGIPIARAMLTHFLTLGPRDTLGNAVEQILSGSDHDLPVVEEGRVLGILTRNDLLLGLTQNGPSSPVSDVMKTDFRVVQPGETLEEAYALMQENETSVLPVVHENHLIGLLTRENLGEFLMIHAAMDKRKR